MSLPTETTKLTTKRQKLHNTCISVDNILRGCTATCLLCHKLGAKQKRPSLVVSELAWISCFVQFVVCHVRTELQPCVTQLRNGCSKITCDTLTLSHSFEVEARELIKTLLWKFFVSHGSQQQQQETSLCSVQGTAFDNLFNCLLPFS